MSSLPHAPPKKQAGGTELAPPFLPASRAELERPTKYEPKPDPGRLLETWLSRYGPKTRQAYGADLRDFANWLGLSGPEAAAKWFVTLGQAEINQTTIDYLATLGERGKAVTTRARRLYALKSILAAGRLLGATTVRIEVRGPRTETYRDTTGPSPRRLKAMLADLETKASCHNRKAIRDLALVRLLYNRGLRKSEAVGLNVAHYDREKSRVSILGKARGAREWVSPSPQTSAALDAWLAVRGTRPGPIFTPFTGPCAASGRRLTARNVNRILEGYGIRPHGLRHAAITAALERTQGDVARVQRFSRHKNPAVVILYDDRRRDLGGQVSVLLDDPDVPAADLPTVTEADLAGLREKQGRRVRAALAGKTIRAIAEAEGTKPAAIRESILWAERKIPGLRRRLELAGVRKECP